MSSLVASKKRNVHTNDDAKITSYVVGFIGSIMLTLIAYFLVVAHTLPTGWLVFIIASLAIVQFVVQLVFFLHLGRGAKTKDRLLVFLFMLMVVLIVVVGSLWIMENLNYRMMSSPEQIKTYLKNQDSL